MAGALFLALPRQVHAENDVTAKYEYYKESDGRITVKAQYLAAELDLRATTHFSVEGVVDSISGATPTGQRPPDGSTQVVTSNLIETRTGVVTSLTQGVNDGRVRVEYARSKENDYVSNGYSGSYVREFNEKNTELQFGFSYNDDTIIEPFWSPTDRKKRSADFLVGVLQLIDPNTTLTFNYSHGASSGFQSDPYKIVEFRKEIVPGLFLDGYTTPENRPSSRDKDTVYVQLNHFVEKAHGSIESSFRFYRDTYGIKSGTLELAWFQKFGEHLVVRPYVRYYQQTAADFYYQNLDLTSIKPNDVPLPGDPFYSSDYRLSKFDATTFGLKVIYKFNDQWSADAMYERYSMHGRDGVTPASSYITADTLTAGVKFSF